jgi:hypothetical protein
VPACCRCSSALDADFGVPAGKTLYDNFTESVAKYGDSSCIGRRVGDAYQYLTFKVRGISNIEPGAAALAVHPAREQTWCISPNAVILVGSEWREEQEAHLSAGLPSLNCGRKSAAPVPFIPRLGGLAQMETAQAAAVTCGT